MTTETKYLCPRCGVTVEAAVKPTRSFMGFLRILCPICSNLFYYPLPLGYVIFYWILLSLVVIRELDNASQGIVYEGVPNVIAIVVFIYIIMSLVRNFTLKRKMYDLKMTLAKGRYSMNDIPCTSAGRPLAKPHYEKSWEAKGDKNDAWRNGFVAPGIYDPMAKVVSGPPRTPHHDKPHEARGGNCDELAGLIVMLAASYAAEVAERLGANNTKNGDASDEMFYLLLHMAGRVALDELGASRRDSLIDDLAIRSLTIYLAAHVAHRGSGVAEKSSQEILDTFNKRQVVYSRCQTVMNEGGFGPRPGSIMFIFAYYTCQAMGLIAGNLDEDALVGRRPLVDSELECVPRVDHSILVNILGMSALTSLNLTKRIRAIGGPR